MVDVEREALSLNKLRPAEICRGLRGEQRKEVYPPIFQNDGFVDLHKIGGDYRTKVSVG